MHATERMRRDLVDGVKIYFDDERVGISAHLIPDKERPLFHISAEAKEAEAAEALAAQYERKITQWRDEP
jgi:phosphomannomutase